MYRKGCNVTFYSHRLLRTKTFSVCIAQYSKVSIENCKTLFHWSEEGKLLLCSSKLFYFEDFCKRHPPGVERQIHRCALRRQMKSTHLHTVVSNGKNPPEIRLENSSNCLITPHCYFTRLNLKKNGASPILPSSLSRDSQEP